MTPDQHARIRQLELQLELADHGLGMPLDRERVQWLKVQLELARKDAANDNARNDGYDILSDCTECEADRVLEEIRRLRAVIAAVANERDEWKERWEAERAAHVATIRNNKMLAEDYP